jgi:hypothetical protein
VLIPVLRAFLRPYRRQVAVDVALPVVQTGGSLHLPT